MLSAAHSPEGSGRKKSSHLRVEALCGLAQTQDTADPASPICHYVLPLIFLGILPKVCKPPMARRKRTLLFFLQLQKIACCTREAVAYCSAVKEIRRGTGTLPNIISSPVLRKKSPIIYLKGAVTRVVKIFHSDAFIGGGKRIPARMKHKSG